MKPGQQQQQQTQTTRPPDFAIPYIGAGLDNAMTMLQQGGPQQYGGSTVVPFSQQTQQAMGMQQQRALQGSPVVDQAQSTVRNIAAGNTPLAGMAASPTMGPTGAGPLGQFMDPANNPYLDATFNRAAGSVNRSLDEALARGGRDVTANAGARADNLMDLANRVYGGAFESGQNRALQAAGQLSGQQFGAGQNALDRQLSAAGQLGQQQLAAAGQAIPLANQDYFDIAQLGNVGSRVENLAGQYQQDAMRRFDFEQQRPEAALDAYISRIFGGNYGNTTSSPIYRNRTAGALGGAASGAAIGTQIMPGWGTAIGALGGGLMGYMGG